MEIRRIFEEVDRKPFVPFVIELENGRQVPVSHPENIIFAPTRTRVWDILVYNENGDKVVFGPTAISDLVLSRDESES